MMMTTALTLISHHLCPHVQRAVNSAHRRVEVDLANNPDWFEAISRNSGRPAGRVRRESLGMLPPPRLGYRAWPRASAGNTHCGGDRV